MAKFNVKKRIETFIACLQVSLRSPRIYKLGLILRDCHSWSDKKERGAGYSICKFRKIYPLLTTGELGYDGLNGTRKKIGPSYQKNT